MKSDGPRDENAATDRRLDRVGVADRLSEAVGLPVAGDVRLDRQAVRVVDVDRRDEVEVGVELLRVAGVVEDHPDAAGLLDGQALVDAGVGAALAEHDLAGRPSPGRAGAA